MSNGIYSHTEGYYTSAQSPYQHVRGKFNIPDSEETYSTIVGNGTSDDDRSNAYTLDWDGNAWFAGDVYVGGTSQSDANKLTPTKEITQAEYDALSDEEKKNGTLYFITDAGDVASADLVTYDNSSSGLNAKNLQASTDELKALLVEKDAEIATLQEKVNELNSTTQMLRVRTYTELLTCQAKTWRGYTFKNLPEHTFSFPIIAGVGDNGQLEGCQVIRDFSEVGKILVYSPIAQNVNVMLVVMN